MENAKDKQVYAQKAGVVPYKASFFRQIKTSDGRIASTYQESFLPYLVGEYLMFGVSRIAIPADDPTAEYLEDLPNSVRNRVFVVDKDEQVLQRVNALMAPILSEIPVSFPWGDYFPTTEKPDHPALQSVIDLRVGLRRLLLGLEYRLQVDLDLEEMKRALLLLRNDLNSQEALINTNSVLGLLNSYQPESVESLTFVSKLAEDRVREFERLLDDELYGQLSEQGYFLGVPGVMRKAKRKIQNIARNIVRGREKAILKIAATPINVATGGLADISAIADLLPDKEPRYLPPIAWFSAAHDTARVRFEAREEPTEPDHTQTYQVMPVTSSDLDALVRAAKKHLGARLRTHYSDEDSENDPS